MPSATPGSGSPLGEEGVPGGTGGMPSGSGIDEELANEVLEERSGPYGTGSAVRRAGADGGVVTEGIGEDLRADFRAERRAAKAEKQAEMEEAHANGQPYLWEETTDWRGNEVEVWIYPDGTEVTTTPPDANGQREVLDVEYAGDSHPVFLGQIPVDGEYVSVFEIPPWNTVIVVDADGNSLGTLEEFDDRIMTVDAASAAQAYGLDVDDLGDTDGGTVNLMWQPMGPPTYDTQLVNADTGEVIITDNSGVQFDATTATLAGYPPEDGPYTQYQAPGNNEYYIVVSADGEIVNAYVDQPDEEWSVLWGLVTHYEDGTTTVDLGPLEFDVDIEGPEVGGAVRVDVGVAEVELGGRYNVENGSWEVNFSASADIGVASGSLDMTVGEDADGHAYFDLEAEVEFMVGPVGVGLGAGVHYYETDDGYMLDVHAEGSASLLGAYAEVGWQGTIVADSEGAMVTQSTYVGAGIEGVGGIRLTGQSQVTFNEDGEVTGWTSGAGLSAVDREGDELGMIGVFGNDDGENWTDNEWLDTGFRERDTRPALPGAPGQDGIDDASSVMDDDPATTGPRGHRGPRPDTGPGVGPGGAGGSGAGPGAQLRDDFDAPPAVRDAGGPGGPGAPGGAGGPDGPRPQPGAARPEPDRPEPSPAGAAGAASAAGAALVESDDITVLPAGRHRAGAATDTATDTAGNTAEAMEVEVVAEVDDVEVEAVEVVAEVDDVEVEADSNTAAFEEAAMTNPAFVGSEHMVDDDLYVGDAEPAQPFADNDDNDRPDRDLGRDGPADFGGRASDGGSFNGMGADQLDD